MAFNALLTPLQLEAGAALLQNQGIALNSELVVAIDAYESVTPINTFLQTIANGTANISGNVALGNSVVSSLLTLASNTCPALADSVPTAYSGSLTAEVSPPGLSGVVSSTGNTYLGNGDVGKFAQTLSSAQSYVELTNMLINSVNNAEYYLGNTFVNMNYLTTGSLSAITLATDAFGADLKNLGYLIDFSNLGEMGTPLAVLRQVVKYGGLTSPLIAALKIAGLTNSVVINIASSTASITDVVQKAMYQAMGLIKNDALTQILQILKVTTPNITVMTDLLDPTKLFPNSYTVLTAPTTVGPRGIYKPNGAVNTSLETLLPVYLIRTV